MTARLCLIIGLIPVALAAGCGGGTTGTTVAGKVTHAGAPVTGGTILFEPTTGTGQAASGTIKADGSYEVVGVPPGECKVTIDTEYLRTTASNTPKLPGGMEAPPSSAQLNGLKYVKIDLKYSKTATTDLRTTVAGRRHTYDIDLK